MQAALLVNKVLNSLPGEMFIHRTFQALIGLRHGKVRKSESVFWAVPVYLSTLTTTSRPIQVFNIPHRLYVLNTRTGSYTATIFLNDTLKSK